MFYCYVRVEPHVFCEIQVIEFPLSKIPGGRLAGNPPEMKFTAAVSVCGSQHAANRQREGKGERGEREKY